MQNINIPGWVWAALIAAATVAIQHFEGIDILWAPILVAVLAAAIKGAQLAMEKEPPPSARGGQAQGESAARRLQPQRGNKFVRWLLE